ncbi:MAG: glycosyl transferase [Burkholderiales bacterium]|jgi:glycosyltransferase involved in cell wall biosynthesis|nr:glycosyl transferase [Burkholderiales bacterium]
MNLNYGYEKIKNTFLTKNNVFAAKKRHALLCFSHLRWDFVYQRPQHLMSRFAAVYDVLYIEEPVFIEGIYPTLSVRMTKNNIYILQPQLPSLRTKEETGRVLRSLVSDFLATENFCVDICWYYTPMMFHWSKALAGNVTIYDCMDELSAFKFAPLELKQYEQELINCADLVFTGGASLYRAKSPCHSSVYMFPSSVDILHFRAARNKLPMPIDQEKISGPLIGFYGVIDERFDIDLLEALAATRSDWSFIIIGPVVKIDPALLPKAQNIYYLGSKTYEELPYYLSNWDVAFIPFAINESTKFISPTKTPEYLAGGKPVVSTPIIDIIEAYGKSKVVHIADSKDIPAFIKAIERALQDSKNPQYVYMHADTLLNNMSWDKTFNDMHNLMLSIKFEKEAV